MCEPHGGHADTPEDHDDGDEDAGPESLEQDIGQGFGKSVRDKKDGEGAIVLATGDAEVGFEAIEAGVAWRCPMSDAWQQDLSSLLLFSPFRQQHNGAERDGALANIGSIKEADEVEKAEPGNQSKVELPEQSPVLRIECTLATVFSYGVVKGDGRIA